MPEATVRIDAVWLSLHCNTDTLLQEWSSDEAPNFYLDQLAQLARSVPDLAATLTTQAEQDAEDDNLSFLRSEFSEEEIRHTPHDDSNESRRSMRRAMDTIVEPRVYTPAQLQELGEIQEASDAGRQMQQQYHGWAPGTSDDEEEPYPEQSERRNPPRSSAALLDEQVMRRDEYLRERTRLTQLRDAALLNWRENDENVHNGQPPARWEHTQSTDNRSEGTHSLSESSLRTTALLQAVRRNPQFSARSRNELQRYILDRERGDERDRAHTPRATESQNPTLSPSQRRQVHREATMRHEIQQHRALLVEHQHRRSQLEEQIREQRNALVPPSENRRRRYWQTASPCPEKRRIDDAIKYLGRLRLCESDQEGQETAEDGGFKPEASSPRDFLVNTQLVPPPPRSSWLKVGGILSGTQHGTCPCPLPSYTPLVPPSMYRSRTRNPPIGSAPPRNTSPVRETPQTNAESTPLLEDEEERWPVKVTIHSVDYDEMTLTGTMEAFNVPDKSSPTEKSSITTYLEGEIIDFNAFTLETKTFKADTRVDGMYWRKLPPFNDFGDDETMVKKVLSTKWLREELMQKWILMRWKGQSFFSSSFHSEISLTHRDLAEKCFVTPSDAQTALTISGFYYVSLRRADGKVEGLYYDPHSNPYQHLSLMPEMHTFPSYTFQ